MREGKLIILATGKRADVLRFETQEERGEWAAGDFPVDASVIIPDAYFLLDSRNGMSKLNKGATCKILDAVSKGSDVILITPASDMIDKRIRTKAMKIELEDE
jgi:hypothetical protein